MRLESAIPALPVLDIAGAVAYYADRFGFRVMHADGAFAIVVRDGVRLHLWAANQPEVRGAEPHLAGSASCRIMVIGIEELYAEMKDAGVVHPNGPLTSQPWGERDFSVLDQDNNCLSFAERTNDD